MKRLITVSVLLILISGACMPAYAQESAWDTLNAQAKSLYGEGHYDRAAVVAEKALQLAQKTKGPNHPDVATSLNNLAELYRLQGEGTRLEPSRCGREPE
jgi:hypothetical protein